MEAIRGLNQEASSMQREEKADLGQSASDPEHSADDQCSTARGDGNQEAAVDEKKGKDKQDEEREGLPQSAAAMVLAATTALARGKRAGGAADDESRGGGGGEAGGEKEMEGAAKRARS